MWRLNRQNRYEIIKGLVEKASPEVIDELVKGTDFRGYSPSDNPEFRRREVLEYLEEMNNYWNKYNIDVMDRQYIRIIDEPAPVVEEQQEEPTKSSVCVIFKDAEEEQRFSQICEEINYGKRETKGHPKTYRKEL